MPFAALVGYRRLWQGSLIQLGKTGVVANTMVMRLVVTLGGLMLGIVLVNAGVPGVRGSAVGAGALSSGVFAGALASWWYYRRAQQVQRAQQAGADAESSTTRPGRFRRC